MDGVYTLDWQEYEYEQNREYLKQLRNDYKRKITMGCIEHKHIVFCRLNKCETLGYPRRIKYEQLDGTEIALATKSLPFDVRKKISEYYNQMYYFTPKVPSRLLNEIVFKFTTDLNTFLVMHALTPVIFNAMRGYCPSCGEPVVNSSYFYWGNYRRKPLRTNKYGLTIMRCCSNCLYSNIGADENGNRIWKDKPVVNMNGFMKYPFVLC